MIWIRKHPLIPGVTSQDGSYLSELVLHEFILFLVLKEEHPLSIQKGWITYPINPNVVVNKI